MELLLMTRKKLGEVGKDQKVLDQVARKSLLILNVIRLELIGKKHKNFKIWARPRSGLAEILT